MSATKLFNEMYPYSHTLPKSEIIKFAEAYADKKFEEQKHKKQIFQSEQFMAQHNIEELRKKFKEDKDKK